MSRGWSGMSEVEREQLRLRLALDLAVDELVSVPEDATARKPVFNEIRAAALEPARAMDEFLKASLTADSELRATFELLVCDAALCWFPAAAAAAADGEGLEAREEAGFSVQVHPSSAECDQVYLLIRCAEGRDEKPSALLAFPADGAPVRAALPEDIDGVHQLVERRNSPLVRAIRDPASRLALS